MKAIEICVSEEGEQLKRYNYDGLCVDIHGKGNNFYGLILPGWNVLPPNQKIIKSNGDNSTLQQRLQIGNYISDAAPNLAESLDGKIIVAYNPGVGFKHPEHQWRRNSLKDVIKQYAIGNEFMTQIMKQQNYTVYTHSITALVQFMDLANGTAEMIQGPEKYVIVAPFTSTQDFFDHLHNKKLAKIITWETLFSTLQDYHIPTPLSPVASAKMHVDENLANNPHYGLGTWMSTKSVQEIMGQDTANIIKSGKTNDSDITILVTGKDKNFSLAGQAKVVFAAGEKYPKLNVVKLDLPHNIFPYEVGQEALLKTSR